MRFEERARRAVQDIHRAVEVMEMSDTKTPHSSRFDQYRTRRTRNQRIAAIAVGLGLPLVLFIVAVRFMGADPESRAPGGQPSTSASPTPLSGRADGFEATFTYTLPLPAGWTLRGHGERYFGFDGPGSADLMALSSVVPARSDCSSRPKPGVGTSSDAMTSWLSRHPALDATAPVDVTLGAASGSWVDVRLVDDWEQSCPDGLTLVTGRPDGEEGWAIYANQKIRFYVLDVPSGDTVTIVIGNLSPGQFDDVIDEAAPVVESFEFTG